MYAIRSYYDEYFDQYRESKEYFLTSKDTKNKELLGMVMSFFQKLLITTLNDRQKEVFESVRFPQVRFIHILHHQHLKLPRKEHDCHHGQKRQSSYNFV